jgi:hypothetical protein
MAWRSSLWARWVGWTALYALGTLLPPGIVGLLADFFGSWYEFLSTAAVLLLFLLSTVFAFVIGVRFRSRWWGLGPLALFGLPGAAFGVAEWSGLINGGGWLMVAGVVFLIFAALLSLVALAGVWWGNRRYAAAFRRRGVSPGGDAATE